MKITIDEIGMLLTFLVSFITAIEFLLSKLRKQVNKMLNPINDNIKYLDISQCKNFLVNYLSDLENNNIISEAEKQRAYEIYDHYTNDLKQNSYIHNKWESLMEDNKNEK